MKQCWNKETFHVESCRSPAEIMFSRRTRGYLPTVSNSPKDTVVAEKREARKGSVKRSYARKSRQLSELDVGQYVFFQHTE